MTLAASVALDAAPMLSAVQAVMATPPVDFAPDGAPPVRPTNLVPAGHPTVAPPGSTPGPIAHSDSLASVGSVGSSVDSLDELLPAGLDGRFGGLLDLPAGPALDVIAVTQEVKPAPPLLDGPAPRTVVRPVVGALAGAPESLVPRIAGAWPRPEAGGTSWAEQSVAVPELHDWELGWLRPPVEPDPEQVPAGVELKPNERMVVSLGMYETYPDDAPLLGEGYEPPDLSETRAYITAQWSW